MKEMRKFLKPSYILILVCILAMLVVPGSFNNYSLMVINVGLIYAIASFGLSIMLGMGGQVSFAGLSFMGVGCYFVGNMCSGRLGLSMHPILAVLLGTLLAGIIAYLLGLILMKLKGTFFTFGTIALVQVVWTVYQNYTPLFGGAGGISGIEKLHFGDFVFKRANHWFYLLVIVVALVALFVERIRSTKLGRSLASVRDNDTAALTLGVDVYKTKVIAFALAGMLAGLSGGLYALNNGFISSDMFNYERSTLVLIITMIGGVNSSFGIILGSLLINVLPEVLRDFPLISKYLQLIYGLAVILMMIFMPMGIAGMFSDLWKKIVRGFAKKDPRKEAAK